VEASLLLIPHQEWLKPRESGIRVGGLASPEFVSWLVVGRFGRTMARFQGNRTLVSMRAFVCLGLEHFSVVKWLTINPESAAAAQNKH